MSEPYSRYKQEAERQRRAAAAKEVAERDEFDRALKAEREELLARIELNERAFLGAFAPHEQTLRRDHFRLSYDGPSEFIPRHKCYSFGYEGETYRGFYGVVVGVHIFGEECTGFWQDSEEYSRWHFSSRGEAKEGGLSMSAPIGRMTRKPLLTGSLGALHIVLVK